MIHVHPENTLVDESVTIVAGGLKPSQKYTFRSRCSNDNGDLFEAFAFYKSNSEGVVNVKQDRAMYGGSYEGVEPMGLFWSLQPSRMNVKQFARMVKKDVSAPLIVVIELCEDWKNLDEFETETQIAKTKVNRWYKRKEVERIPVRNGRIRGTLFVPNGPGSFPAVVDMFGGAGGLFEFRAAMLASRGFLTMALAIYAYDDLPFHPIPTNLDYYEEAVVYLQNHPRAKPGGVGVLGTSFGAEISLCMATLIPGVTCSVCINGGNVVEFMPCYYRGLKIPALIGDLENMVGENNTIISKNWIEFPPNSKGINKPHFPPFHKSKCSFLFLGSELDMCYDMNEVHGLGKDLLRRYGGGIGKYKFVLYPGAGHLLELPNTPLSSTVFLSISRMFQYYGGRIKEHAKAQEKSWTEILNFLHENIVPAEQAKL